MQRLVKEQKDYYNEEGIYQISLYFDESSKEVNMKENFSEEKQEELKFQNQIITHIELLLPLFQKPTISFELMQESIHFSSALLNLETLTNFPRHKKFIIINFLVIFLRFLSTKDPEKFKKLGEIFFQKVLPQLNYASDICYDEIDQGLLGVVRSDYFHLFSLERAKEINRLKTKD